MPSSPSTKGPLHLGLPRHGQHPYIAGTLLTATLAQEAQITMWNSSDEPKRKAVLELTDQYGYGGCCGEFGRNDPGLQGDSAMESAGGEEGEKSPMELNFEQLGEEAALQLQREVLRARQEQWGSFYAHLPNLSIDWTLEDGLGAPACRVRECPDFGHIFKSKLKLRRHLPSQKMQDLNWMITLQRPKTPEGQGMSGGMPSTPKKAKILAENIVFKRVRRWAQLVAAGGKGDVDMPD
ncbi:hypothetical protein ACJZ2D_007346 [Fusarium nematophilum]